MTYRMRFLALIGKNPIRYVFFEKYYPPFKGRKLFKKVPNHL